MSRLSISLLGPFRATLDGRPVAAFESAKVRALLAYLAVESDRPHQRQALAGLLWPDRPEKVARTNLRHALAVLRSAIGDREAVPPLLLITRETIQLNANSDYRLDVAVFSASVNATTTGETSIQRLEKAVALYRGDFLAGLALHDCASFEEWALAVQERLRRQVSSAFQRLVEAYERRGSFERACEHAWRWVEREPWRETAHRQLMRLLARCGRRSAAIAQYRTCCRLLAQELEVEPSQETTRLYERIRDGTLALQDQRAVSNLPVSLMPLIGRAAELDQLARVLQDPTCRLLTLVGPGGVGKTRLALEAAARKADSLVHGAFFVDLSSLDEVESVVFAIAEAIGFSFFTDAGYKEGFRQQLTPREQLTDHLRDKDMLLVLDGLEHLIDRGSAVWVTHLLRAAPAIRVLATSRVRLGAQGEQVFPLGGMSYPRQTSTEPCPVDDVGVYPAAELFVSAAQRASPSFALTPGNQSDVARVCGLVEGLPLAILLAAAWIPVLTPSEIAAQIASQRPGQGIDFLKTDLQDVPAHHQSMRAVLEHSWRLLPERGREVFRGLSVFSGFTWHAAQHVTGATLHDLLVLVRHSLLYRSPAASTPPGEATSGRYRMHELLRQYAAEKLRQSALEHKRVRDRHSEYYIALFGRWVESLDQPGKQEALAEMEAETENVRAAWEWAVQCGRMALLDRATDRLIDCMASDKEHM